jgi:hypothetical protein
MSTAIVAGKTITKARRADILVTLKNLNDHQAPSGRHFFATQS